MIKNNNVNQIVFEVFKSVHNMNYSKNDRSNIIKKLRKAYRYFVSGYIFRLKNARRSMLEFNRFEATNKVYSNLKICVYTVNTGKYDIVSTPIYVDENIDYFIITDNEVSTEQDVWKKIDVPQDIKQYSALEQARYIKTHPHRFFSEYDYSIFIDGNIKITCDIRPLVYSMIEAKKIMAIHRHQARDCVYDEAKAIYAVGKAKRHDLNKQLEHYKKEAFPRHFGLFETNVIIRQHNHADCIAVMDTWWQEIKDYTKRDQMSFTYALWKNNKTAMDVLSLGNNSRLNPYFIVDAHL